MATAASRTERSATLKVAVVITGLYVGGAETFLSELLKLKPADIEVRVYSLIDGGPIRERIEALGIEVTELHMQPGRPSLTSLFSLVRMLRAYGPDVVHTLLYHADLMGGLAARLAGVPRVVWHLHNSDLSPDRVRLMTRAVVRVCALLSRFVPDVIISCSEAALREHVIRGYTAKRFRVVPNGVDTERFSPDPGARGAVREEFGLADDVPVIGLFARLDPQKDHEGFFSAVREFFDRGGDAQFLLAGRNVTDDHWKLAEWRDATPRPDRVAMLGERDDVPRLMSGIDIVTSTSLGEAFPMVLIEAMACGIPVAATDVGDSALIVSETGEIAPPGDAVAMADAWLRLISQGADARRELGTKARARVLANYRIEEVAATIWAIYRNTAPRLRPGVERAPGPLRVAYVSLQAVAQGQDSWAAVTEIVGSWRKAGWRVDTWYPDYPAKGAPGAIGRAWVMARLQLRLRKMLDRYDVLYVRGHTMAYLISWLAARRGLPVVQECNGTYEDLFIAWPAARLGRPLFEYMQRWQYRAAAIIFCGTEEQQRWLTAETGHERIAISPNGANVELFRPDAPRRDGLTERFVLFFGQFAPWQGIDVLIAAKSDPAWPAGVDLVFVGDGEKRPAVERAAASDPGVYYLGRLPYAELAGVISHSLASTSAQYTLDRGETGFSALKLYESMACGVPVIGTDYPGVGDVIRHYESGLVVAPGDAHELASAAAYLAEHPDEAAKMGARGRAAVLREGSWKARADQRREAIESVIGASAGATSVSA